MNKLLLGTLVGVGLGFFDGLTAWLHPAARPLIQGILVGSSIKGMVVGIASALLARKVQSVAIGAAFGAALGLLFAYIIALEPLPDGKYYYLEIMLPGFIVGAMIGFITQRWGALPATTKG